ncbi:LOW QUALITY PROTEIN: post-GPI attachment to proteins factor 6 [Phascolarctos cinereus]|uniref:LOW QUALITY PROTEIN: transmembrane protein 8A n=1 Tax=Phascolarctos cinereus TaxID=38626 RepID=A0A6P5LUQ9_PHACI|nr:LOW QUALITY PROTEIN: transmembrane protein 8A [Phascolarctos cinereus]
MGRAGVAAGPLAWLLFVSLTPSAGATAAVPATNASGGGPDLMYSYEYFVQSPQKLSFYSWYGSAKLYHFRVPSDTALLRWLLQAFKGPGSECTDVEITVHFRYGAPPVINPLGTKFPANTTVRPSFSIKLIHNNTVINVSSPAPGDWFIAAHLPRSPQKIEIKGVATPCTYIFQPDMLVLRLTDVTILQPDMPLSQTLFGSQLRHLKVFIPKYTSDLQLELRSCVSNGSQVCPVRLIVGPSTLPQSFQKVFSCTDQHEPCRLHLPAPPWDTWLQVTAEGRAGPNISVTFDAVASFTVCRPGSLGPLVVSYISLNQSLNASAASLSMGRSPWHLGKRMGVGSSPFSPVGDFRNASALSGFCLLSYPVIREELDVVSVRFWPLSGSGIIVWSSLPTLFPINLNTGMDSGSTFIVSLKLNTTLGSNNISVVGCLSATSPVLSLNTSQNCTTAFFEGYSLYLSDSSREAMLSVPYPETGSWYLSLQLVCPTNVSECEQIQANVEASVSLTPCFNDCGPYGQCRLLRRHGYLYASCTCKAGWQGWSCTDDAKAQTVVQQNVATLLLTLSNLMFLLPVTVAVYRHYVVEASVYAYTMFFSTFYHACDQPGVAVLCIMDYDTLQYCDFLGSVVSIWVTILCMARVKTFVKYVLFVLGTLIIAMSLQLDRRGIWNMMGPCLCALIIMISMWVYRCIHRHHCYPTSWKRWAFYLLPGISLAFVAIAIYAFMGTNDNYFYTHSIWHVLMASSVAFLLPPRDKNTEPWAWSQKLTCRYQLCKNTQEELYAVT